MQSIKVTYFAANLGLNARLNREKSVSQMAERSENGNLSLEHCNLPLGKEISDD